MQSKDFKEGFHPNEINQFWRNVVAGIIILAGTVGACQVAGWLSNPNSFGN